MDVKPVEFVMIATVISISEWTFAIVTVNYLRVGEVVNFSTDTTVMILYTASAASYSRVIHYYSLKKLSYL